MLNIVYFHYKDKNIIYLIMMNLFFTATFVLWLLYLIAKYVLKPYLRMLRYAKYNGAVWIPFVPVLGAFKHAEDAFKTTGDENYFSKRSF